MVCSGMNTTAQRFTICVYGRKASGFSYLLGICGGGLAPTSGAGSDFGLCDRTSQLLASAADVVRAALAFVPAGSLVQVSGFSGRLPLRVGTREQFAAVFEVQ